MFLQILANKSFMERSQPGRLLFFVHGTDKKNNDFLARTGLVYRLNWAVWAELGWGGLGWAGLGRTGLGQTGLGRTMGLAELSWSGPNWTGLGQSLHCTMYICHLRLVQYIQTSRFEPISQVLTHKVKLSSPQIRSGCSRR